MKVYYKLTQKYDLNNHGKKASNSTKEVAVVTATLSEIGIETSLLMPKSVSAYSPTEFALEGPSESTLSTFSMWKCRRCGLVFDEGWVASLHKSVTNHLPSLVGPKS